MCLGLVYHLMMNLLLNGSRNFLKDCQDLICPQWSSVTLCTVALLLRAEELELYSYIVPHLTFGRG